MMTCLRFFFLLLLLLSFSGGAQVKDKNWLLIDSVKYEEINPSYRPFLDSVLTLYHKAGSDTVKLDLLTLLAEGIEEEAVWTRYNQLVYALACKGGDQYVFLRHKANALNNMGYEAQNIGDFQAAIRLYSEALTLREKIHDKQGIANSLNNLGYVFDDLHDLAKAEEYYMRALKIREEIGEKVGLVNSNNNLGTFYYYKQQYDKAIFYHERAMQLAKQINYKRGVSYSYNNLGNVYRQLGDLKKALAYFEEALVLSKEVGEHAGLSGSYYNFSVVYEKMKDYKKAEMYALKALDAAAGHNEKTREAAQLLFGIYRAEKKFEKALQMHLLYIQMRDSSNNEASRKASVRQQFKYEFEKKEATLKVEQEKKDAIAGAEKKRQNLFLLLVGAVAIAVAVVALVVIRSLRITRRQKKIIEHQKHLVEEKQKEILDSIHYAKRIQRSLLPSEKYVEKHLKKLTK